MVIVTVRIKKRAGFLFGRRMIIKYKYLLFTIHAETLTCRLRGFVQYVDWYRPHRGPFIGVPETILQLMLMECQFDTVSLQFCPCCIGNAYTRPYL
jgi:hypothetical protein